MNASSNLTVLPLTQISIDGATIHQDRHGRFCLNDLHKASGGEVKNKPSNFLQNDKTQELVAELIVAGNPSSVNIEPVSAIRGGPEQGTYVVKELVYAYAMWISPAFHLKVIRTFDTLTAQPKLPDLNDPTQLRGLLLGYAEQNIQLTTENQVLSKAIETITHTEHGVKFQQACKILNIKQQTLAEWLRKHNWDRYLNGARASTYYSENRGYCETKYSLKEGVKPSGQSYSYTQTEFFILPKGMQILAKRFGEQP
ncbi:KilA-N domain-containing protein [Acinetobacter sp. SwsAc2]|uniref:KilA-N domain-containing protein n=1 Tax=Acinetobacter sp. SwsAc2 TaxID=2749360 RepID=UPI002116615E|nr:KilA-N domain-containing protein [Acinetobacter sp. SwsAc2]